MLAKGCKRLSTAHAFKRVAQKTSLIRQQSFCWNLGHFCDKEGGLPNCLFSPHFSGPLYQLICVLRWSQQPRIQGPAEDGVWQGRWLKPHRWFLSISFLPGVWVKSGGGHTLRISWSLLLTTKNDYHLWVLRSWTSARSQIVGTNTMTERNQLDAIDGSQPAGMPWSVSARSKLPETQCSHTLTSTALGNLKQLGAWRNSFFFAHVLVYFPICLCGCAMP
jgi:hypothetical protein